MIRSEITSYQWSSIVAYQFITNFAFQGLQGLREREELSAVVMRVPQEEQEPDDRLLGIVTSYLHTYTQNGILLPDDAESSITDWPVRLHVLAVRMRRRRWRLVWMLRMIIGLSRRRRCRRQNGLLVSSPSSPALHE